MMKVQMYVTLRPLTSASEPQRVGDRPWKTIYDVTVRLTSSAETERSFAMVGMEGKYILEAMLVKVAATETMMTIKVFWWDAKILYGTGWTVSMTCSSSITRLWVGRLEVEDIDSQGRTFIMTMQHDEHSTYIVRRCMYRNSVAHTPHLGNSEIGPRYE
jgi:hypothetical protein